MSSIQRIHLSVPEEELDALKRRLNNTRWPDAETADDWSQGVPVARMRALIERCVVVIVVRSVLVRCLCGLCRRFIQACEKRDHLRMEARRSPWSFGRNQNRNSTEPLAKPY